MAESKQKPKRKSNGKNSPVIGSNGVTATQEELNDLTRVSIEIWNMEPINIREPEAVKKRIEEYLNHCIDKGFRPGNMGMYTAIGMSKQGIDLFIKRNPKHPSVPIIQKGKQLMSMYRELLMVNGKVNPVTGIFWQKNYDGLKDVQEIGLSAKNTLEAEKTPSEIMQDIDIDVNELD
ncbi:MAG: hypothetical protein PHD56_07790 [Anaerostipes sp.]|nr:hypothetical protein [Anaerostipes sp.]